LPEETVQRENIGVIDAFKEKLTAISPEVQLTENDAYKLNRELIRLHQNIVEIGEMSVMSNGESNKIIRKCDQLVGREDNDSYILSLAKRFDSSSIDLTVLNSFRESQVKFSKASPEMSGTQLVTLKIFRKISENGM
jgi:hypothetical protein